MHLQRPRPRAFQIRPGHMHLRPRRLPRVDLLLQFQIRVRLERSRRADRSHAARQIQPRKTESHLAENPVPHRIKHVVVHPHQPRNHAVPMQVDHLRIFRHIRRRSVAHRLNLPLAENRQSDPRAPPLPCRRSRAHESSATTGASVFTNLRTSGESVWAALREQQPSRTKANALRMIPP